jgi:hypothetical protein
MKKRVTSLFLALALCLTLLPATVLAADVPTGVSGEGTETSPYEISTAEQFYAFAEWYNANAASLLEDETNTYAELTADIDLNSGFTFTKDGYTGEGIPKNWTPIGLVATDFSSILPYLGEFNGNGHTISGMYINEEHTSTLASGLFGYFAGNLHDVKIINSYIFSKSPCTGSFAGIAGGTIQNCEASAVVISDEQNGRLNGTGGIVGNLNDSTSEVIKCVFSGSVES